MTKFLKFLQIARVTDAFRFDEKTIPFRAIREVITDNEWAQIELCQPFVFKMPQLGRVLGYFEAETFVKDPIDAPFPVFSIEHVDGDVGSILLNGDRRCGIFPQCLVVIEESPMQYKIFALIDSIKGGLGILRLGNEVLPIVRSFLEHINVGIVGSEITRVVAKVGSGKTKKVIRIRRIIHVIPKKESIKTKLEMKNVDWTHRFEVRGHWRKIDSLGKDRNGDYSVSGFTWVINHTKGPEGMPLVKKVRLIDQSNPMQIN